MNSVFATASSTVYRRAAVLCLAGCLAALCGACSTAHYSINPPLELEQLGEQGYALRNLRGNGGGTPNSDSLVVILAFSGGGYRAAALAHAVMSLLADTSIQWEGRRSSLLQEVDVISAVSGGSLAAAYFALHPDTFLEEFPARVLGIDLQSLLIKRMMSPVGLWRQASSTYGRGDLLQEVLDEHVFMGRRFADISRHRPMVYINATDMRHGQRFEFSQDQFDHLCSDLDRFPVARAVAASMAVPIVFSPITVWNHRADCPAPPSLRPISGQAARSRYVHLVDGGLADNTGLNTVLDTVAANGGLRRVEQAVRLEGVRKRVIISVNAQVTPLDAAADSPETPSLMRQLRSLVNVPIDRHADAKVQNLVEAVRQWQGELRAVGDPPAREGAETFHVIELNMSHASNSELAAALQRIPTALRIDAAQLPSIRRFVREGLAANLQWQRLMTELSPPRDAATVPLD
jgi:NTE family protein